MSLTCSAPGKLYLFGEYGVLAGGWGVVSAVDRRVTATRRDEEGSYRARGVDGDDTGFVETMLGHVDGETDWQPGQFETDARDFYDDGRKLGLGSSAASGVALVAAALLEEGADAISEEERRRIFAAAEAAHRDLQGGRGSGGGLAAASFGGVLGFRRGEGNPGFGQLSATERDAADRVDDFRYETVDWPDGLQVRAVWLGEPAETTSFVGAVEERRADSPGKVDALLAEISRTAEEAIEAFEQSDVTSIVEAARRGDRAMEWLGQMCGVEVVIERHRRLRRLADSCGLAAKPSGAGGGDFSLVFGDASADWERLAEALPVGARLFDLAFGAEGLRVE